MFRLFKSKKIAILGIVIAVVIVAAVGILLWQLTKDTGTYTVQFVTNGGNAIESMEVEKGTVLAQSALPVPAKRGEMFLAWYTDAALTQPYWNTPVEGDMTLYASYLKPAEEETTTQLVESVIPFAEPDFCVSVCSGVELTNENIDQYILLTINYGHHPNGEEIRLSVVPEGGGIYRISANFAEGGEYVLSLVSDAVTFNPEDQLLVAYGLTDALRTLHVRIHGQAYMNGAFSDKVADIPAEEITVLDADSVTICGDHRNLMGATEENNGIVHVGEGDALSNYYKILGIESASGDAVTYAVRPARIEEVYDRVFGYQWEDLEEEDFVINEEVKQQVLDNLATNQQLNNYITYLATAATYTPTYQAMSMEEFGEVVLTPLITVVTPSQRTLELDLSAYNDKFVHILGEEKSHKFVKLTVGAAYAVKLGKFGSMGSLEAEISMQISLWVYVGVGGDFEVGWLEYDIDCGSTTLTQTEISFGITLMTSDSKRRVNINDEIEAIYNSAKEPTPENLLEQYNELMSGGSKAIELFNQEIFEVPVLSLLYGAVEISVPVRFVVSLDMQASFTSYFTVLNGNDFGMKGDQDTGLAIFCNRMQPRYQYRLELRGRIEVRAGLELGLELSLGYNLASVSLNVQVGMYGQIHGYFFYEVDHLNSWYDPLQTKGGAYYFELGIYVEINLRAEVCHIKRKGGLFEAKWDFCKKGQKEIVYGFVNPTTDVITMEGKDMSVRIADTGVLQVYVFDLTKERDDDNPRIVENYPFDASEFTFTFNNSNFKADPYSGEIRVATSLNAATAFESKLTIHYTGAQMKFREALTKYVTVRYSMSENTDWDNLKKSVKVDFTIDGKVIFTRELPYSGRVSLQPYLYYHLEDDGSISAAFLTEAEKEAVGKAGVRYARWNIINDTSVWITEDTTVEAERTIRRQWKITLAEDEKTQTIEADHGETVILPFPEKTNYSTARSSFDFIGWKAEDGRIYAASTYFALTQDLVLTPYYQERVRYYTVTFDANGGTINSGEDTFGMQCAYGTVPYLPFEPEREATEDVRYVFTGWSPKLSPVTADVTYRAQWKEIRYHTVTFDAGSGQFDADGTRTITLRIEEGQALTREDIPMNPYLKGEGGYYAFEAWSSAVSAGTVITGDVTFTASYQDTLVRKTGITISDGRTVEDIASFLDGTNQISGYSYTLNTEYYGNVLQITAPGLVVSGEATNINIRVANTEVTLHNLKLTQNQRVEVISANGKATIYISGDVELTSNTDAEAIRGDSDGENPADIHILGLNRGCKLTVNAQAYGIAVYGALTIDNFTVEINMPKEAYTDPEFGWAFDMVALQVHNHPEGILTVTDSDIIINGGVVNVAWLDMTDSELRFTAREFVPGTYFSGLHIMNYYQLTKPETLILLKNSHISFQHDIVISIIASLPGDISDDPGDDVYYMVNTSLEEHVFASSYASVRDFLADVAANGYDDMVVMDEDSSIT